LDLLLSTVTTSGSRLKVTLALSGIKASQEFLLLEGMNGAKLQCYQGPSMPGTELTPLSTEEQSELPAWLTMVIGF